MKNTTERDDNIALRPMISIAEVLQRIPISRSTLEKLVKQGRFPKAYHIAPMKLGFSA